MACTGTRLIVANAGDCRCIIIHMIYILVLHGCMDVCAWVCVCMFMGDGMYWHAAHRSECRGLQVWCCMGVTVYGCICMGADICLWVYCVDACMYVCMDGCMDVCVYVHVYGYMRVCRAYLRRAFVPSLPSLVSTTQPRIVRSLF